MMRKLLVLIFTAAMPAVLPAQETAIVNPVYTRAQTFVNDGNATAGRALVDSMVSAAAPGSNDYAEAVYWRAVLAGTAADAEMDYRRIVVDYPRSPRVEDALIRLSQLEIARASYDGAIRHLNTLITDYPQSPSRTRAGYWMARALFDKNDIRGGCVATADALARVGADDVELRNQIAYLNQRCAGVDLAVAAPAPPPAPSVILPTPAVTTTPVDTPPKIVKQPVSSDKKVVDSAKILRTNPPTPINKTVPVEPRRSEPPVTVKRPAETAKISADTFYSVQIAAYNVQSQAVAMVAKLKKVGYEARVDGTEAPFRVRIGKYATKSQAGAVQRSLTAKNITGFVVQAENQ